MQVIDEIWGDVRGLAKRYARPLIVLGIIIRVIYFLYIVLANKGGGDISQNITDGKSVWASITSGQGFFASPLPFLGELFVLSMYLLGAGLPTAIAEFWFAFSMMVLEIGISLGFYYVAKAWSKSADYGQIAVVMWLFNPIWFLQQVFSLSEFGYHPTDLVFVALILAGMYWYQRPGGKKWAYVFLALSMSVKFFTVPLMVLLPLIFIINPDRKSPNGEKDQPLFKVNWPEIKDYILYLGIPFILTFVLPIGVLYVIYPNTLQQIFSALACSVLGGTWPLWLRVIPPLAVIIAFVWLVWRKPGPRDLWTCFNWSVSAGAILYFESYLYLRYLIYPMPVGIARQKDRDVTLWSILGTILTFVFYLFHANSAMWFVWPGNAACPGM